LVIHQVVSTPVAQHISTPQQALEQHCTVHTECRSLMLLLPATTDLRSNPAADNVPESTAKPLLALQQLPKCNGTPSLIRLQCAWNPIHCPSPHRQLLGLRQQLLLLLLLQCKLARSK
jgi:hypothetical protein